MSALGNLADLDMGRFCNKLVPLKDEVVMVLVREEEIGASLRLKGWQEQLQSLQLALLWYRWLALDGCTSAHMS
jgi:hypothetical protein